MNLLKEDNGNYSMARILSLLTVLCGVTVGLILALNGKLDSSGVQLSLGMIGLGIAGKTVSKKLEA